MLRRFIISSTITVGVPLVVCERSEIDISSRVYELSKRLSCTLDEDNLLLRKTLPDGVKIFSLRNKPLGNYNVRVIKGTIKAPMDEVVTVWENQNSRKKWDPYNCKEGQTLSRINKDISLSYLLSQRGLLIPSRDFVYYTSRVPGGTVGSDNYMSVAFVNVDANTEFPTTIWAVRGQVNSILLLEPISAQTTNVTHIVEINTGGWVWKSIAAYYLDRLGNTLSMLKKDLEKEETMEEAAMSIEAAAKLRFNKHKALKEEITLIADDVTANQEDLKEALRLLEKKLSDVKSSERKERLDLSELRSRIENDIARIKERLGKK
jgi:hypothetical protein